MASRSGRLGLAITMMISFSFLLRWNHIATAV
jgi:hypothetical protein